MVLLDYLLTSAILLYSLLQAAVLQSWKGYEK
jgi:hypothetical protein